MSRALQTSSQRQRCAQFPSRSGFTLVEMMVSVGLVLLMMLLFTQVFELASGSVSVQRGIAENDQRSRTLTTIVHADLAKRTMRIVSPFFVAENVSTSPFPAEERRGYLYYSENDPDDDTDDVLQFTVQSTIVAQDKDETPYIGRAAPLSSDQNQQAFNNLIYGDEFLWNRNQPDWDDGVLVPNQTAESRFAEISYFLRNGNLYRRVVLIRNPIEGSDPEPTLTHFWDSNNAVFVPAAQVGASEIPFFANPLDPQLRLYPDNPLFMLGAQSGNFLTDFDFSVRSRLDFTNGTNQGVTFHGAADLDNSDGIANANALGFPNNRFGHNHVDTPDQQGFPDGIDDGQPREFVTNGAFMGRFTHEETSNQLFQYPQANSVAAGGAISNPYAVVQQGAMTLGTDGVIDQFRGGPRRAEDILMSNVHSFDVKIWDEQVGPIIRLERLGQTGQRPIRVGGFVDMGHGIFDINGPGDYYQTPDTASFLPQDDPLNRNRHAALSHDYGPRTNAYVIGGPRNRVFDTWHSNINLDPNIDNVRAGLTQQQDIGLEPPPFRALKYYDRFSVNTGNAFIAQLPDWQPNTQYQVGDLVFPDSQANPNHGHTYYYRCVQGGTSTDTQIDPDPFLGPRPAGSLVRDVSGTNQPVVWRTELNVKPVRAIQITVRFMDQTTGQMRQATIVHSLID